MNTVQNTVQNTLSKTQMGIYLECNAFPERTTYNLPYLCVLQDNTDTEQLKKAVETVIAAHPGLDTRIVTDENGMIVMEHGAGAGVREYHVSDEEFTKIRSQLVRPFQMDKECLSRFEIYVTDSARYFFYDIHHCIFDGASLQTFNREIVEAYLGKEIPQESFTVYDFAAEEQVLTQTDHYQKAKEYWAHLLDGCETDSTPMPDTTKDTPVQGWYEKEFALDSDALNALRKNAQASVSAVFTAAMGLVIAKYIASEQSLISTICAGRDDDRMTDTMGMFVKTFPFVTDLSKYEDTTAFVHAAAEQLMESRKNVLYSYVDLAADYSLTNDINFAFQGKHADHNIHDNDRKLFCKRDRIYDAAHIEETKLLLEVNTVSDGVFRLHMGYRADLYTQEFAEGMANAYICAVKSLLKEEKLKSVSLVDEEELALLDQFNETEKEFLKTPVISQFRAMAERYPEHLAAVCGKDKMTYKELDELSERIGAYCVSLGLGAEDVVGILIPRCIHMTSATLGVQKAGCAYQPLDMTYPQERLEFMLKDSEAKLLITTKNLRNLVPEYQGEVLYLEDFPQLPKTEKLNIVPGEHDLFIMLYTSGTTGLPKGVQLEQINISAFSAWYRSYYGVGHNTKVAAYASYGFDANMMDLYAALTNGGTLYIIEEDMRLDYVAMDQYLCENEITDLFMTTQIGRSFALETTCPTLRQIAVGGEKLVPVDLKDKSFAFYNCYGPTECTIMSTVFKLDGHYDRVPIGKVLDNMKGYVLDSHGNRLPIGACGELVVAGPQVARGYRNRPEKTAEVFIHNPFCEEESYTHAYKTGDIVRYLPDGVIDIIGRNDGQVKVRGFRIELTEVEEVIRRFDGITDATVTAFDDPNGGKAIAAYITSSEKVDLEALRRFIADEKPPYMVPAVFMQIDAIPYNQNQKVNKRALPKPELQKEALAAGKMAPMNRLEEDIASLIEEVLHTKPQDITEPLAYVGLTSISSIRLATLVYKKYGVQMEARKLVSEGNMQMIENCILDKWITPDKKEAEVDNKSVDNKFKSCYLTFEQQGVYAECQMNPQSTQYNMPFCMDIPGDISAETLKEALLKVITAHDTLHCHFTADDKNNVSMELVADYVPEIPVKAMTAEAFEAYKKDFVRPFDLKEVAARYEIIECEGLHLLMDIHHLLADGSSIDLFAEQLCKVLDGEMIDPENCSYFDYASEQKISEADDDFFTVQMGRIEEASQLIPDVYESNLAHTEGSVSIKTDLNAIAEYAESLGVTPAAVGLAAVQLTVARFLAETCAGIATISGGRSNLKIADTMGMFVNTLALTSQIDHTQTVAAFVRETADTFQAVIAHEHYPFARLAKRFDFHPGISYAWQVGTLQTHSTKDGELHIEGLALQDAKIPVSVFVEEENGGTIRIVYDESMYSEEMMKSFGRSIAHVLDEMRIKNTLQDISLTGEEDWKKLDGYNREFNLNYDQNDNAISRFQRMAQEQPDKLAAVYKEKAYTYKELDDLTDRLAGVLYERITEITGKKDLSECVVAILSGRSENAFIMPLAVLKTGCAYEPLDPGYPQERLNFMISDANARLLLAQDDLRDLLPEYTGETMLFGELYAAEERQLPDLTIDPKNLFIMLYTSGSTGTPKGVQIEHRNVVAFAHGAQLDGFYGGDSVTAAYASFGFDVNMADTFCTLLNGGTVHLIPEEIRMNLDELAQYFDNKGITEILMTTQVGVQFLQNYPHLKTMRYLMMGGEKLPAVHPENLNYTIINGYGPTENCCGVSMFHVQEWESNIPIGKPLPTIHGYVLDKTGHRLPAGAAGEYCLAGPQVSRGYLNRPDKTAEAYENCPFDAYRMYHTGDIVRYRQDGNVEFVGRKDGQVKIRGFRIETKEVEAVILDYPGVKDATVQAYDYESGGKYLAAFVVYDGTLDTDELSSFIKERKPAYMVPAAIMQLDQIPLTVNQKVDKKALPKPQVQKAEYVAPQNKTEEDFCRIFAEILGLEKISVQDSFFEIGGSSITAMKVVLAAASAGHTIVYQDLFNCPTPKDLSDLVSGLKKGQFLDEESVSEADDNQENASPYGPGTKEIGPDGYHYGEINALLRKNTLEAFRDGEKQEIGNVLLLGATGYLGSHVLNELLTSETGMITCLVRPGKGISAEQKLIHMQEQYFAGSAKERFNGRIRVLECEDVDAAALSQVTEHNMTVINCAASVKHFAQGNEIEKANLDSVKALIDWCIAHDSRLIHISTESVMGTAIGNMPPVSFKFNENVLYVGQEYESNQYVCSKFLAERSIYEAILKGGLNGRVIRVGNLAPRMDGQFQVNYKSNSFMNCLAAYQIMGMIPYTACPELGVLDYTTMDGIVEFSPIEKVAESVCLLAKAPKECVCFVASNNHPVRFGDIVMNLSDEDQIQMVDGEFFANAVKEVSADPEKAIRVGELIAYATGRTDARLLGADSVENRLTMQVLYSCGFRWPETGSEYVKRFVEKLRKLGFFK